MKPSQFVAQLRHIASKIEASTKPHKGLVAMDIRLLLNRIAYAEVIPNDLDRKIHDEVMKLLNSDVVEGTDPDEEVKLKVELWKAGKSPKEIAKEIVDRKLVVSKP